MSVPERVGDLVGAVAIALSLLVLFVLTVAALLAFTQTALFRNTALAVAIIAGAIRSFLRGMVETVQLWFRRKPKREAKPFLTVEYPHKVYAWSHLVTERECTTLLMDATLGDWEKPLCQKLGDGAYRMKLQFYRVEGGRVKTKLRLSRLVAPLALGWSMRPTRHQLRVEAIKRLVRGVLRNDEFEFLRDNAVEILGEPKR